MGWDPGADNLPAAAGHAPESEFGTGKVDRKVWACIRVVMVWASLLIMDSLVVCMHVKRMLLLLKDCDEHP